MAQEQDKNNPRGTLDIGAFRKIRLKPNRQGYWEIWWTDASGSGYLTRRESCRTKERAQAEAYLDAFCAAARDQQTAVAQARLPTVDELCRRWLEHVAPAGKDRTGRWSLTSPRRELGGLTAERLDSQMLQDYARTRFRQGIKPGTVRRELGALRTVLWWGARQKMISREDLPFFDEAVMPQDGPPRTRFLDEAQEQAFWAAAMQWPDLRVRLFVALGLETAARRGAILDLTWDRVDLTQGMIDYRVPGARATKKRRVQVPISDRLRPVLEAAYRTAPYHIAGRPTGRVIGTRVMIQVPFDRFTAAIGMPWVTAHVLRHTWGSLKVMRGASLYDVSKVMGDTIKTLEAYYLHLSPNYLRQVINL